jgi:hypothetical protein
LNQDNPYACPRDALPPLRQRWRNWWASLRWRQKGLLLTGVWIPIWSALAGLKCASLDANTSVQQQAELGMMYGRIMILVPMFLWSVLLTRHLLATAVRQIAAVSSRGSIAIAANARTTCRTCGGIQDMAGSPCIQCGASAVLDNGERKSEGRQPLP